MSHVFVVSGPSGVGKGTLCKKLLTDYPDLGLQLSVSMTTRSPRQGETDGKDYFFVSRDKFEHAIKHDQLLEWAEYNQQYYGTPWTSVEAPLKQKKPVLLEIEPVGAFQVKKRYGAQSALVFILPPSLKTLLERLTTRGTNTPEDIKHRLTIAQEEIAKKDQFDHQLVNDDLATTTKKLANLIKQTIAKPLKSPPTK